MIIRCAMQRHESRGLHYTLDYPNMTDEYSPDTILVPDNYCADKSTAISA